MRVARVKVVYRVDVEGPDDEDEWLATEDRRYSEFCAGIKRVPGADVEEVDVLELIPEGEGEVK